MSRSRTLTVLCLVLAMMIVVAGPVAAKKRPLNDIPLVWKPTDDMGELGLLDLTDLFDVKIQVAQFSDERDEPALIAENVEDAEDGKVLKVTTNEDVGAWTADRFRDVLDQMGLNTVDEGGDVVIEGEVRRFFVQEDETYEGDVGILLTVKKASGEELWKGMASGSAERWGRSYKAENYYEVLSDSVLRAVHNSLSSEAFRDALTGKE